MARNYNLKKARPFLTFLVVLLVLCLLAMIFAFVWKLSNGFSDWSWFDTESVTEEVEEDVDEISGYSFSESEDSDYLVLTSGNFSEDSFCVYTD